MNKNISTKKGFTLIEMIVSLGIFTVVAVIAVGGLLKIMDANRKSFTLKTAINNMNFALESMSREMRVGNNYYCTSDYSSIPSRINDPVSNCPSNTSHTVPWVLAFNSTKPCSNPLLGNIIYAYRFKYRIAGSSSGTLQKAQQNSSCSSSFVDDDFQDVVSDDVIITNSIVTTISSGQPRAFFWFKGYTGVKDKEKTSFALQTSVSQRIK